MLRASRVHKLISCFSVQFTVELEHFFVERDEKYTFIDEIVAIIDDKSNDR